MTDQHNARALGCYGNKQIKTPNIDKLAQNGVLFKNAICQSGQCRPSRYSIWSGEYPRSHGLLWNPIVKLPHQNLISKIFSDAGYVTASIGKHHMHMENFSNHHFHYVVEDNDLGFARHGSFLPYVDAHPGKEVVGANEYLNSQHPAGTITQYTIDFLRKNYDESFLLFHSFDGPHSPICPSLPWANLYKPDELNLSLNNCYSIDERIPNLQKLRTKSGPITYEAHKKILSYYYGLVSQIDYNIGLIMEELESLDLLRNTIIVFSSDHGEMMGEHGIWTKGKLGYDATIRFPLIIKAPDLKAKNIQSEQLVGSIDILPTLLSMTGFSKPENIQGESFESLLTDTSSGIRDFIITETGPSINESCISVRSIEV